MKDLHDLETSKLCKSIGISTTSIQGHAIRDALRSAYNKGFVNGARLTREEIFDAK